jgi:sulfate permease family protein
VPDRDHRAAGDGAHYEGDSPFKGATASAFAPSSLLSAGVIVVILLFLTKPIANLPKAVLGATIIAAALGLVDPAAWRALAADDHARRHAGAASTIACSTPT